MMEKSDVLLCHRVPLNSSLRMIERYNSDGNVEKGSSSGSDDKDHEMRSIPPKAATTTEAVSEPALVIRDDNSSTTYYRGKLLGKGGFARVYEVTNPMTNRSYADKVINKNIFAKKSSSKDKVKREISLHKDLIHRNIVRFYSFFDDANFIHIILENCSMKSLLHVLKHRKRLLEPEVRYYMGHICEGVRFIHKSGILHRDLKLGNMFLTGDMIVKIGDFGLATRLDRQDRTVTLCGTPNYIAPEVLAKKGHGIEADVWALGCMMYAMLVGTPPFETKSLNATYEKISRNEYSIPELVSSLAGSLIRKLLHPTPTERGHLLQVGHTHDLVSHDFFKKGLMPHVLPPHATFQTPNFEPDHFIRRADSKSRSSLNSNSSSSQDGGGGGTFRSAIRHKINQIFSSKKTPIQMDTFLDDLHDHLFTCLQTPPTMIKKIPHQTSAMPPIMVSKWIDYSNKYGFGYQMSDGSVGVIFNDDSKLSVTPDRKRLLFTDAQNKTVLVANEDIHPDILCRVRLLEYFTRYMDENLADCNVNKPPRPSSSGSAQIVHWIRNSNAVVMVLNNCSIQVNFLLDHLKLIIWTDSDSYFATLISSDKSISTLKVTASVANLGSNSLIYNKLFQTMSLIRSMTS